MDIGTGKRDPESYIDDYSGGCPKCGRTNGCLNVGRDHWFVCDEHMLRWYVGSNLFSCWHEQTEEGRQQNIETLKGYSVFTGASPRRLRLAQFLRRLRYRLRGLPRRFASNCVHTLRLWTGKDMPF